MWVETLVQTRSFIANQRLIPVKECLPPHFHIIHRPADKNGISESGVHPDGARHLPRGGYKVSLWEGQRNK